jgi:hypothetical protein
VWDWRWYLVVAEKIGANNCDDAYKAARVRSSISRAYYAAFNSTQLYMSENGHSIAAPSNSHGPWWDAIHSDVSLSQDEREVGLQGRRLHSMRRHADYDNAVVLPNWTDAGKAAQREKQRQRLLKDVKSAIFTAHTILRLLKVATHPTSDAPLDVQQAAQTWPANAFKPLT